MLVVAFAVEVDVESVREKLETDRWSCGGCGGGGCCYGGVFEHPVAGDVGGGESDVNALGDEAFGELEKGV